MLPIQSESSRELEDLKNKYNESSEKDLSTFDKNFFIVATAVFAFTVTFIKDIINVRYAHWIWTLVTSWIFMAISMALTIVSYFISSYDRAVLGQYINKYLYNQRVNEHHYGPRQRPKFLKNNPGADAEVWGLIHKKNIERNEIQHAIRGISITSFIIGLLVLCLFLMINFYCSNTNANRSGDATKDSILFPSSKNPINPRFDTILEKKETKHTDSSIIVIKPDTIFLNLDRQGCNKDCDDKCSCPPGNKICKKTCHKKRKL